VNQVELLRYGWSLFGLGFIAGFGCGAIWILSFPLRWLWRQVRARPQRAE
jgi:hypothetical protein